MRPALCWGWTVIPFPFEWVSAKFGICTVESVNGTLVEATMCTFILDSTHFIFINLFHLHSRRCKCLHCGHHGCQLTLYSFVGCKGQVYALARDHERQVRPIVRFKDQSMLRLSTMDVRWGSIEGFIEARPKLRFWTMDVRRGSKVGCIGQPVLRLGTKDVRWASIAGCRSQA